MARGERDRHLRLCSVSLQLAFVEVKQEFEHSVPAQINGGLRREAPGVGLEIQTHQAGVQAAQLDRQRVEPVLG